MCDSFSNHSSIFYWHILIYTDFVIAISALILMLIVGLGIVLFYKPIVKRTGKKNLELITSKTQILYQIINGIKEMFAMQRKESFLDSYEKASDNSNVNEEIENLSFKRELTINNVFWKYEN